MSNTHPQKQRNDEVPAELVAASVGPTHKRINSGLITSIR